MLKAKKYDWKDSNMALFGSDTEKQVKKESAESEPAWKGAGQDVGLEVWRIVKFKVEKWDKEDHGKFYDGDSYIILNTYKEEDTDALLYDVHFWIGKYSSQDEYGTAAYKTVELDTLLDDKPIQHREVMNHESDMFKHYFPYFQLLKGGADSGFRRVLPEQYKPRLLMCSGMNRKNMVIKEIPMKRSNLNNHDVFIIDFGQELYQFNGKESNKDEKFAAGQYMQQLKSDRCGKVKKCEVIDQGETSESHPFLKKFDSEEEASEDDDVEEEEEEEGDTQAELLKLSDANTSGQMKLDSMKTGNISKDDLQSDDVFLIDTKTELFVWVGSNASKDERKNAMSYAHNYLKETKHPFLPVTVLNEGAKSEALDLALAA